MCNFLRILLFSKVFFTIYDVNIRSTHNKGESKHKAQVKSNISL